MNDYKKLNNFYEKILEKYSNRQIQKSRNKKCYDCNRSLNPIKYFKKIINLYVPFVLLIGKNILY